MDKNNIKDEKKNGKAQTMADALRDHFSASSLEEAQRTLQNADAKQLREMIDFMTMDIAYLCYHLQALIQMYAEPVIGQERAYRAGNNPTLISSAFVLVRHGLAKFDADTHIIVLDDAFSQKPPERMEELLRGDLGPNNNVAMIIAGMVKNGELR